MNNTFVQRALEFGRDLSMNSIQEVIQFQCTNNQLSVKQLRYILQNPSFKKTDFVILDFVEMAPINIGSWRGRYSDPALRYDSTKPLSLDEFLALLEPWADDTNAEYRPMLWVANEDEVGSTGVIGVNYIRTYYQYENFIQLITATCVA